MIFECSEKIIGKAGVLAYLKKIQKFYRNGMMSPNPKTHPSVEERIKRLEPKDYSSSPQSI